MKIHVSRMRYLQQAVRLCSVVCAEDQLMRWKIMEKKVLLVADDEKMNRTVISKFFKNDYTVLEAENGEAAVDILENNHVDAMLLDIIMPKKNGLEVIDYVREHPELEGVGILVATSTKEKTERHALGAGADDIVSKPYDPVVIRKRLENILAMKELKMHSESLGLSEKENQWKQELHGKYQKKISDRVRKMNEIAEVIENNLDNKKMLKECTANLKIELDQLRMILD